MNAELPRVPERLDHLRFLREVFVPAILNVTFADERLEVGAVLDAVRRVDVDHLQLSGHPLLLQQRVHHQQRIAGDQPVGPAALVLVEVDRVAQRQILERRAEQPHLQVRPQRAAAAFAVLHAFADRGENAHRVDALVHVQRHGVDVEARALGLAGPVEIRRARAPELFQRRAHGGLVAACESIVDQLFDLRAPHVELQRRVDVRVVAPFGLGLLGVVRNVDQADLGVVLALILMAVTQDPRVLLGSSTRRPRCGPLQPQGGLLRFRFERIGGNRWRFQRKVVRRCTVGRRRPFLGLTHRRRGGAALLSLRHRVLPRLVLTTCPACCWPAGDAPILCNNATCEQDRLAFNIAVERRARMRSA